MYEDGEDVFYYITLYNENYPMPPMPEGADEGILKGLYKLRGAEAAPGETKGNRRVHLLGSGSILREALRAQEMLAEHFGVAADVWSVTSYKELRREALEVERWNLLHPTSEPRQALRRRAAARASRADRRRQRLHEVGAGDDRALGAGRASTAWAPTASAAARPARPCAASSRWTPSRSPSPPSASSPAAARIDRAVAARAMGELGLDPDKVDPVQA